MFYTVLEEKSGFKIEGDSQLLNLVTTLSKVKREYDKIEVALNDAKTFGYGVVAPSLSELSLEEPEIIKQGKQYGVKLKSKCTITSHYKSRYIYRSISNCRKSRSR